MNFGLAAATLGLVVLAELPDKTFISAVILGARHRSVAVWIGAFSALVLQAGIASVAGRLIALLPHDVVGVIVGVLFLLGAAYFFLQGPPAETSKDGEQATEEQHRAFRVFASTFAIVALAEFGDLTQVVIANMSARYRDPLSVFVGASVGFGIISGLGVLLGRTITRVVPLRLVQMASGVALLGLGVYSLVTAL